MLEKVRKNRKGCDRAQKVRAQKHPGKKQSRVRTLSRGHTNVTLN